MNYYGIDLHPQSFIVVQPDEEEKCKILLNQMQTFHLRVMKTKNRSGGFTRILS